MKTTTTIIAMVLIVASIGVVASTFVNAAFAGVALNFKNPGQCHQFANGIGVPHGKDVSRETAQFCKQF